MTIRTMERGLAAAAVTVAVAAIGCGSAAKMIPSSDPGVRVVPQTTTVQCVEGDACWNCRTMGNRRCGRGVAR